MPVDPLPVPDDLEDLCAALKNSTIRDPVWFARDNNTRLCGNTVGTTLQVDNRAVACLVSSNDHFNDSSVYICSLDDNSIHDSITYQRYQVIKVFTVNGPIKKLLHLRIGDKTLHKFIVCIGDDFFTCIDTSKANNDEIIRSKTYNFPYTNEEFTYITALNIKNIKNTGNTENTDDTDDNSKWIVVAGSTRYLRIFSDPCTRQVERITEIQRGSEVIDLKISLDGKWLLVISPQRTYIYRICRGIEEEDTNDLSLELRGTISLPEDNTLDTFAELDFMYLDIPQASFVVQSAIAVQAADKHFWLLPTLDPLSTPEYCTHEKVEARKAEKLEEVKSI